MLHCHRLAISSGAKAAKRVIQGHGLETVTRYDSVCADVPSIQCNNVWYHYIDGLQHHRPHENDTPPALWLSIVEEMLETQAESLTGQPAVVDHGGSRMLCTMASVELQTINFAMCNNSEQVEQQQQTIPTPCMQARQAVGRKPRTVCKTQTAA